MSGFVASPAPPATPAGTVITTGAFWPEIDVTDFRKVMRTGGGSVPDERVIPALKRAIIDVGRDLVSWRGAQITAGHATLADVPGEEVDGECEYVILWREAVYGYAMAALIETSRDITATNEGARRAEESMPTSDDHRRNALRAIRSIKGRTGLDVDLL